MDLDEMIRIAQSDLSNVDSELLKKMVGKLASAGYKNSSENKFLIDLSRKVGEELLRRTKIRNLTPHSITFVTDSGDIIKTIEPSGTIVTVATRMITTGKVSDIPITSVRRTVVDLPDYKKGVIYIVSSEVESAIAESNRSEDRSDIYFPADPVKNSDGQIIGYKSLGYT